MVQFPVEQLWDTRSSLTHTEITFQSIDFNRKIWQEIAASLDRASFTTWNWIPQPQFKRFSRRAEPNLTKTLRPNWGSLSCAVDFQSNSEVKKQINIYFFIATFSRLTFWNNTNFLRVSHPIEMPRFRIVFCKLESIILTTVLKEIIHRGT